MAHKKGVGSTDNGRDSNPKFLGVKLFGGQKAIAGNIIIRQRGTKYHPGLGVGMGRDFTIYSLVDGKVTFTKKRKNRTYVNVLTDEQIEALLIKQAGQARVSSKPKKAKAVSKPAAAPKKEVPAPKVEAPIKETPAPAPKPAPVEKTVEAGDKEAQKSALMAKLGGGDSSKKDDLKMIKGVGPKLEGTLNELGLFSFEQVSKMTDTEYDMLDGLLTSFKGRAKRDDWAGQAKALMSTAHLIDNPFKAMPDDLKIIEGIGPKIEGLLKKGGVMNWEDLANADVSRLQEILDAAGDAYKIHSPTTWPDQSALAVAGKWAELEKLQDDLMGGKEVK